MTARRRPAEKQARKAARKAKRKANLEQQHPNKVDRQPLDIEWRTETQRRAWKLLNQHLITFLLGSAGSGKTFLAMAYAINAVLTKQCDKIVLTRPIVEAGERLGFLPGTFGEKVNPYMQPLYDTMDVLVGKQGAKREMLNKAIVIAPLCYMRGRTFNDAICIFDEAQNASYLQLKLFLSRFGQNTKVIVTGDPQQSDLPYSPPPLSEVVARVQDLPDIAVVTFNENDVVRHPLVAALLRKL
jgi:phosphate starvation-inducible PhoH-like protein